MSPARSFWARPSWLVAATVVAICLPAGRSPGDAGTVQVTAADLASLAAVVVVAGFVVARRRSVPPEAVAAFGPLIVMLGATTVLSQDIVASLPGAVRFLQIFVLVPIMVLAAVGDRFDAAVVGAGVVSAGLIQAAVGLWQVATGTGASYGGRPVRAVGTFGAMDVMGMATVAGFGIILCLAYLLAGDRGRPVRPLVWAALAVQVAALVCSLSRGSWIAVSAAAVLMLLVRNWGAAVRGAAVATAVAIVLVFGFGVGGPTVAERARSIASATTAPDQSVNDRYSLWSAATGIWQDHPVTGVGVKNFAAFRDSYAGLGLSSGSDTEDPVNGFHRQPLLSPHNEYLLIASEQGLMGAAGFAVMLLALLYGLWRSRDRADPRWLAAAGFLTWLLVDFCYADLGGPTSVLLSVMLGLAASAAWRPRGAPR